MKTVIVPRGIPGSGKSTWVLERMAERPNGDAVRINNDDLSSMLFGSAWNDYPNRREVLERARYELLKTYLSMPGVPTEIFVDNTNISVDEVRKLESIAYLHGAEFLVIDQFLSVDDRECVLRDSQRDRKVGKDVIYDMAETASRLKPWVYGDNPTIERYDNDPSLPWCVLMDIDGTVAIKYAHRGIYDGTLAHLDTPHVPVIETIRALRSRGYIKVIAMSGRGDNDREVTERWIERHVGYGIPLFMRKAGDARPDWVVKHELFQEHIAGQYHVLCSFDDRDQVVHLWRNRLGLPTMQVAEGTF